MKTVGIVGGIGPESTIDYYRSIVQEYRRRTQGEHYPAINIVSIDMTEMLSYVAARDSARLIDMLGGAIRSLKNAGSDFAVMASNTPHIVFEQLQEQSSLELISIVDAACEALRRRGLKKALLTGTLFTMRANFYAKTAQKYGVDIIVPDADDMNEIQNVIFPELEEGIIIPEKKEKYINIVNNYVAQRNVDCVILGCTELPLMISEGDLPIPVMNTSRIHVEKIVDRLLC